MPRSVDRIPRRPSRAPRFDYRANPLYPNARRGNIGPYIMDAVSGNWFPERFAFQGPFGLVDSRVGSVVDLDGEMHEMVVTAIGGQPVFGQGNLGTPVPVGGYPPEE